MTSNSKPTVLIVPGLRGHVADHWQTLLERQLPGARSVPPLERDKLSCAARVAALEAALAQISGPVILVAHSAGVMITLHWSRHHRAQIRGALLATPPDLETPLPDGYPQFADIEANGWLPIPRAPLPFRCIVAASSNDPLARIERVAEFARDWGARLVELGPVGHLNPASGYGEWPRAVEFIAELS